MSDNRLIVALDFSNFDEAAECVDEIGDAVSYYKVGMELYHASGNTVIRYLKDRGKKVFLDLKFLDIPNTVSHAVSVLGSLGVDMLNVHASGGIKMMRESVKALHEQAAALGKEPPKLIAVTVLTSMDEEQFADLNIAKSIPEQVVNLALLAKRAGLDGVVASPNEASAIREACGSDFLIVTPGVRPEGASVDDQSRVATPAGAFKKGATHIVVGRPITKAKDRRAAAEAIVKEIRFIH